MAKRKQKTRPAQLIVVVTIEGGIVRNVDVPEGVRVIVKDYDVDLLAGGLSKDSRGKFAATIWEPAE